MPAWSEDPVADDDLTELIRTVIVDCPFAGEGHRKVRARLRRDHELYVGKNRVLRLMRSRAARPPAGGEAPASPAP